MVFSWIYNPRRARSPPCPGLANDRAGVPGLLALFLLSPLVPVVSPADLPRGPSEIRDAQLLAQPRLTLPAVAPWTTRAGALVRAGFRLWANSFSWTQDVAGRGARGPPLPDRRRGARPRPHGPPGPRRQPRRGRPRAPPVARRGRPRRLHRLVAPRRQRPRRRPPAFLQDAFRVEGKTDGRRDLLLERPHGLRAGRRGARDPLPHSRRDLRRPPPPRSWPACRSRPGTGPFDGKGLGGGAQLVADVPLVGLASTSTGASGSPPRTRARFAASSTRPCGPTASSPSSGGPGAASASSPRRTPPAGSSRTSTRYPGLHWIVNVTGRIDLGERTRLDLGFTENLDEPADHHRLRPLPRPRAPPLTPRAGYNPRP